MTVSLLQQHGVVLCFMKNGEVGVFCGGANTKARLNDCKVHHNGSDGLDAFTCNTYVIRKYPGTCK